MGGSQGSRVNGADCVRLHHRRLRLHGNRLNHSRGDGKIDKPCRRAENASWSREHLSISPGYPCGWSYSRSRFGSAVPMVASISSTSWRERLWTCRLTVWVKSVTRFWLATRATANLSVVRTARSVGERLLGRHSNRGRWVSVVQRGGFGFCGSLCGLRRGVDLGSSTAPWMFKRRAASRST